jgi:hypothetical protein
MAGIKGKISRMSLKPEMKIFISGLLGAGLLYLPALLVVSALPDKVLPADKDGTRPENGMLPFAMLWFGIFGGGLLIWLISRRKANAWWQNAVAGAIAGLSGAVALTLALPVLARGWEGFLLWFNPGLGLIGLILLIWGGISGAILGLLNVAGSFLIQNKKG